MFINTSTQSSISTSLSHYLDIPENELDQYIDYAAEKAQCNNYCFNTVIFQSELTSIFSDLQPEEKIDEILLYHLTRRLNNSEIDYEAKNLKELLLSNSELKQFLAEHNVAFEESNGHPIILYRNRVLSLRNTMDTDVCYLRGRLGYGSTQGDYCFNGFALRDLLMKNTYTRELYDGPEFIKILSRYLKNPAIQQDFFSNSTYYCLAYKLPFDLILFDGDDNMGENDKNDYFLTQLCMRLLEYKSINRRSLSDINNPILRVSDSLIVPEQFSFGSEIITLDMIKQACM